MNRRLRRAIVVAVRALSVARDRRAKTLTYPTFRRPKAAPAVGRPRALR